MEKFSEENIEVQPENHEQELEAMTPMDDVVPADKVGEIKHEAIARLEAPIERIVEQIREKIESGYYDFIIGDDTSGRIPTLILSRIVKEIAKEKDARVPETLFVVGRGKYSEEEESGMSSKMWYLSKYAKQLFLYAKKRLEKISKKNAKALLVTDVIETGDTIMIMESVLKAAGFDCDIASINQPPGTSRHGKNESKFFTNWFVYSPASGELKRREGTTPRAPARHFGTRKVLEDMEGKAENEVRLEGRVYDGGIDYYDALSVYNISKGYVGVKKDKFGRKWKDEWGRIFGNTDPEIGIFADRLKDISPMKKSSDGKYSTGKYATYQPGEELSTEERAKAIRQMVVEARKDIEIVAEKAVDWYRKHKKRDK